MAKTVEIKHSGKLPEVNWGEPEQSGIRQGPDTGQCSNCHLKPVVYVVKDDVATERLCYECVKNFLWDLLRSNRLGWARDCCLILEVRDAGLAGDVVPHLSASYRSKRSLSLDSKDVSTQ